MFDETIRKKKSIDIPTTVSIVQPASVQSFNGAGAESAGSHKIGFLTEPRPRHLMTVRKRRQDWNDFVRCTQDRR